MKTLFMISTFLFSLNSFSIQFDDRSKDQIIAKISIKEQETTLIAKSDTFVWNINGYSCQLPGITIDRHLFDREQLVHDRNRLGRNPEQRSIGLKDPNFRFCKDSATQESLFGNKLIPDQETAVKITIARQIIIGSRHNSVTGRNKNIKLLQEITTVYFLDQVFEDIAELSLEPQKESL